MNTLRVQCETCQAWLRVRDAGFVGEVHACPNCGSMVLISHETAARGEASERDSAAPAAAAMVGLSSTLETAAPPEASPQADASPGEPVQPQAALPETFNAPDLGAAPTTASPAELPVAPPARFAWAPLATAGVMLLSTGAVLVTWFLSPSTEAVVAATDPTPTIVAPADDVEPPAPTPDNLPETAEHAEPVTEGADEAAWSEPLPPAPNQQEPRPSDSADADAIEPAPAASDETHGRDDPTIQRVALAETMPREFESDELPVSIDPLSLDPGEIELVLRRGGEGDAPRADPEPMASEPETDPEPSLDQRLAAAARQAGVFVRRGPTNAATSPATGPAEAALAYVLPSIGLSDVPLDEAVRLIGDIAGVPVTLDAVALRRAGVAATKRVEVATQEKPLADVLAGTLAQARLSYVANGPHVTVARQGADDVRTITHKLADLAADDPQRFATQLRRLVPLPEGASMSATGELTVAAPLGVHFDLVVLCERLRVARGLPTDSKYPRKLLRTEPSLVTLAPKLERRTTFSFVEPTPLAEVFDYWRRATGLTLLVDWRSLSDVGMGPRTLVECSVTNRPWQSALDGVLGPLGLAWSATDQQTLSITTSDAAAQRTTIEFYHGASADDLQRRRPSAIVEPFGGFVAVRAGAEVHRAFAAEAGR